MYNKIYNWLSQFSCITHIIIIVALVILCIFVLIKFLILVKDEKNEDKDNFDDIEKKNLENNDKKC